MILGNKMGQMGPNKVITWIIYLAILLVAGVYIKIIVSRFAG